MAARNEGRILQLSSLAVYSATKAYVHSFARTIINEVFESNVVVTALLPGATNTKQAMK